MEHCPLPFPERMMATSEGIVMIAYISLQDTFTIQKSIAENNFQAIYMGHHVILCIPTVPLLIRNTQGNDPLYRVITH